MAKNNYRKMYETPEATPVPVSEPETIEETPVSAPEPEPEVKADVIGAVIGCGRLNIRKEPNTSAKILCEVTLKSELIIDPDKSTDEWYSVCTPAGVEGFCMKQFVALA